MSAIEIIPLNFGQRSYSITIGSGAIKALKNFVVNLAGRKIVVVTNQTVAAIYLETLKKLIAHSKSEISIITVADGEQYKTFTTLESICGQLLALQCDRKTVLIALGGGVIGDMTGFAAAIYQRGIDFIQVPTTLLAQVDSSIGGKTAVNHSLGKNMIGAFHQPIAVFSDTDTFATLQEREFAAGMAEVIKHGLIIAPDYVDWLESNQTQIISREPSALTKMVCWSCEIKADVVQRDERETTGLRALLNLGHTFGHAIETSAGYGNYLHGEAVAMGTVLAAEYSREYCGLSIDEVNRIKALFKAFGLPIHAPPISANDMLIKMLHDKKNESNQVGLVLLNRIGDAVFQRATSVERLKNFLEHTMPH